MEVEKGQVATEVEQESNVESIDSEAEAKGETEVSEGSEGKEEGKEPKLTEEVKQEIIANEYAKWQAKTLTPMSQERDSLKQQVSDLNAKLEDKSDDRDLAMLLKTDTDELGKEEALKLDEVRRRYATKLHDYRDNHEKVSKQVKENEEIKERLGGIERRQMAKDKAYELLIPQDASFQKQLNEIVEELEQAETPEQMERLLKIIAKEKQGKKVFKPDSSKQSGSGEDISKLSARELLIRGEKKK